MELNLILPVPTSINKLYINEYQWDKELKKTCSNWTKDSVKRRTTG